MTKKTDKKQQKFINLVAQGINPHQACIKAGYSEKYAKTNSHKLRERYENEIEKLKPKIQEVLEKKFNYDVETSFKKLNEIQELALLTDVKGNYANLAVAVKAEELKGKMYGCYELDNKQKTAPMTINFARNYD